MAAVRRAFPIALLCLLALSLGAARANGGATQPELVEVVVGLSQKPLATTRWAAGRQLQSRTMVSAQTELGEIAMELTEYNR